MCAVVISRNVVLLAALVGDCAPNASIFGWHDLVMLGGITAYLSRQQRGRLDFIIHPVQYSGELKIIPL